MTMISRFGIATLLVGLVFPALADEYQDAVSKAFPGFQILKPSEIRLDEVNREIYAQVRDHPGLITGRINADNLTDFAALIRGPIKKQHILNTQPKTVRDHYDGYLVVCLALNGGGYKCEKLNPTPIQILIPHSDFLLKLPPGKGWCTELLRFRPPNNDYPEGAIQERVEITWSVDAVDLIGVGEEAIYISRPDKTFLKCYKSGA
jgi:hypothetical protein